MFFTDFFSNLLAPSKEETVMPYKANATTLPFAVFFSRKLTLPKKEPVTPKEGMAASFPSSNGNELSLCHTRTLAIGKGYLEHTAVMDWYVNEIKELASGDDYFFVNIKSSKIVKMGRIAYLSDRPEKCSLLREMLLETFGLGSNWASAVD